MRKSPRVATLVSILVAVAALVLPGTALAAATSPTSPVNLATPVDFGAAKAAPAATVVAGDARFEVLGDGLIRMEYSPSGSFEDAPTVNALNRRFAVPRYRVRRSGGWLTIATSQATLRYRLGSGPFGPDNTSVRLGNGDTVTPQWENVCPFNQVCDAGAAALTGGANIQTNHAGYQSIAGFIGGLNQGSGAATWSVLGAPAGQAVVTLRYSNYIGALGGPAPRTIDLTVNGSDVKTLTLPPTNSWDDWSTVTATVDLSAGTNTVGVLCAAADSCNVNVDTLSVAPGGAAAPSEPDVHYLGGYTRGFDTATYGPGYSCPTGTPTAAQCTAALPEMHPGILDQAGYRLLDDSQSAVWTANGWVAPRAAGGDVQDGYLFVYGHDYGQALADLNRLTGPSPLLPEYTFGVWFSRLLRVHHVRLREHPDPGLPGQPCPARHAVGRHRLEDTRTSGTGGSGTRRCSRTRQGFLNYAKQQGIHVTLNIHASIADDDPQLPATQALAGTSLADDNACFTPSGTCKTWDWSSIPQAESYFALHQPFEAQGVSFWWLDWCCDSSTASDPGVTPDAWINHLYAQELANKGRAGVRPVAHRQLLPEPRRGLSGRSVVRPHLDAGVHRRHVGHVEHAGLPGPAGRRRGQHRRALRLERHRQLPRPAALEPRPTTPTCTPAGCSSGPSSRSSACTRATATGCPGTTPSRRTTSPRASCACARRSCPTPTRWPTRRCEPACRSTRPLYLDYPDEPAAYANPGEYLYGPDVLVAPVTTPGTVSTQSVWFPPGRWTDWFTGATFTGPSEQTLTVPLDRTGVFVKAGGIVPEEAPMSHVGARPDAPTIVRVYPGADGSFSLYQDSGTGTGYEHGQYSLTPIDTSSSSGRGRVTRVSIGPAYGRYPGQPSSRSFSVRLVGLTAPDAVLLDGRRLPSSAWRYVTAGHTVIVPVAGSAAARRRPDHRAGARRRSARPSPLPSRSASILRPRSAWPREHRRR